MSIVTHDVETARRIGARLRACAQVGEEIGDEWDASPLRETQASLPQRLETDGHARDQIERLAVVETPATLALAESF